MEFGMRNRVPQPHYCGGDNSAVRKAVHEGQVPTRTGIDPIPIPTLTPIQQMNCLICNRPALVLYCRFIVERERVPLRCVRVRLAELEGYPKGSMAKQDRGRGRYRSRYRTETCWDSDMRNRVPQPHYCGGDTTRQRSLSGP